MSPRGTLTRETFHRDLDRLSADVVEMATLARSMLAQGVQSFVALDKDLAKRVVDHRDELAHLDDDIEERALKIAALQQPMARDLRALAAGLKLITYINRVGRYGKDIAQITLQWPQRAHLTRLVQIPQMAETVDRMLGMVVDSYGTGARLDVPKITEWEETLDATRWTVFRESLTYMAQDAVNIEAGAHYMMIARYLERCGDNVCKMAEKVHYMLTGERVTIR